MPRTYPNRIKPVRDQTVAIPREPSENQSLRLREEWRLVCKEHGIDSSRFRFRLLNNLRTRRTEAREPFADVGPLPNLAAGKWRTEYLFVQTHAPLRRTNRKMYASLRIKLPTHPDHLCTVCSAVPTSGRSFLTSTRLPRHDETGRTARTLRHQTFRQEKKKPNR